MECGSINVEIGLWSVDRLRNRDYGFVDRRFGVMINGVNRFGVMINGGGLEADRRFGGEYMRKVF